MCEDLGIVEGSDQRKVPILLKDVLGDVCKFCTGVLLELEFGRTAQSYEVPDMTDKAGGRDLCSVVLVKV